VAGDQRRRLSERAVYLRPAGVPGVEALHAQFVRHAYRPHSHPTWTVAVIERGAAAFDVDATHHRADRGELFVLEPEAVHTGMAAVPEGWQYKVLYLDPELLPRWDVAAPRAARWTVFRDVGLRDALLAAHATLVREPPGLAVDEALLRAVALLRPHLRPGPVASRGRAEHAAVRRAAGYLRERFDRRVPLAELAQVAGLSRFELVRRFHQQMGLTPHGFQTDLRIAQARRLLAAGERPAAVAAACGFADQPHLTRVFRAAVGVTPARY